MTKIRIWVGACALGLLVGLAANSLAGQAVNKPGITIQGRYQIVFRDAVRADTFLLDTETGRTWTRSQFAELKDSPVAWLLDDRLDTEQDQLAFAKRYGMKAK